MSTLAKSLIEEESQTKTPFVDRYEMALEQMDLDEQYSEFEQLALTVEEMSSSINKLEEMRVDLERQHAEGVTQSLESLNHYDSMVEHLTGISLFENVASLESVEPIHRDEITLERVTDLIKKARKYLSDKYTKFMEALRWVQTKLFGGIDKMEKQLNKLASSVSKINREAGDFKVKGIAKTYMQYRGSAEPEDLIAGMEQTNNSIESLMDAYPEIFKEVQTISQEVGESILDALDSGASSKQELTDILNEHFADGLDRVDKAISGHTKLVKQLDGVSAMGGRKFQAETSKLKKRELKATSKDQAKLVKAITSKTQINLSLVSSGDDAPVDFPAPSEKQLSQIIEQGQRMIELIKKGQNLDDILNEMTNEMFEGPAASQESSNRDGDRTNMVKKIATVFFNLSLTVQLAGFIMIVASLFTGGTSLAITGFAAALFSTVSALVSNLIMLLSDAFLEDNSLSTEDNHFTTLLSQERLTEPLAQLYRTYTSQLKYMNSVARGCIVYAHSALEAYGVDTNQPDDVTGAEQST